MFEFAWPWLWWLLPLPLLIRWWLKPAPVNSRSALKTPFLSDFRLSSSRNKFAIEISQPIALALAAIAWTLLIGAAARPQWINEISEVQISGRDLMLAIDVSGSMQAQDFSIGNKRVDRLTAAREVANDFIKRRTGDRVGLIVFGSNAYLQMPLSFDLKTVQEMLNSTFIGIAGKDHTAIGDAIGLAIKRVREYAKSNRVLILLTDGVNNAGSLDPNDAADIAAQEGMKIYTIGIGASRAGRFWGMSRNQIDEATLKQVAHKTGGRYFRANNTNELIKIYQLLDKLEVIEREQKSLKVYQELYPLPLALAGFLAFLILASRTWRRELWTF